MSCLCSCVNNQDNAEPRVTIKRDGFLDEFSRDVVVSDLGKLPEIINERNVETNVPMYLVVEWRYTWNVVFIDTPGLLEETDYPDDPVDREALVQSVKELIADTGEKRKREV